MKRSCAVIAILATCGGAAAQSPAEAVRGISGAVEVDYPGGRLIAKAGQTPSSPVLVRVVGAEGSTKQRIEFMGVTAGTYDLRDYVQKQNGDPASDLRSLPVRIVSQLPPSHGTDLFLVEDPGFSLRAHYRELLIAAGVAWIGVPVVVLVRRAMRKRPVEAAPVLVAPPPTIAEQLSGLLDSAASRHLSIDERGRLELLLLQFFAGDFPAGDDPAQTVHLMRAHPNTKEIIAAVEQWLHGRREGVGVPDSQAAVLLKEFRERRLTPASVAATGVGA